MTAREKHPFVNHVFGAPQPVLDVPRGSQQEPKPEPMQGAPRWARVAASEEMAPVLEAASGKPKTETEKTLARMGQLMGEIATDTSFNVPTSPHQMKHGSEYAPTNVRPGVLESVTDEVYEMATLPGEPTTEPLDARIKRLLAEDVEAFDKDVATFDGAALLAKVYKTISTSGPRQEVDRLPLDEAYQLTALPLSEEPTETLAPVSNLDSTVVLTRMIDELTGPQSNNNDLRQEQGEQ